MNSKKFPRTFWIANIIELVERWAWYGFFLLLPNYLTGSADQGCLEFSQAQKGTLMGIGTGILYFLPVFTGALADKWGYKKVLFTAFVVYVSAFLLMPICSTYPSFFAAYLLLAVGAALFKPIPSATISKTTNEGNSSIGFGIFYMMVNIGAFFGPLVSLLFKKGDPKMIFYISAAIVAINFLLLLFYKEPERSEEEKSQRKSILDIFRNMACIFKDFKFVIFLLIVAGFWTMYNQLFYTLPIFISQWVNTEPMYNFFVNYIPFFANNYSMAPGVMDAEFVCNLDALYIIVFQLFVSSIVMKMKPLNSMISGFLVCTIGMAMTLFFQNVIFTMVAILVFSLGEMAGSPKITEYIGRIAPADKKALYMGYSFIPVFLGNILAGVISGPVFQNIADKVTLVKRFVTENGLSVDSNLSQSEFFNAAASQAGMTPNELTQHLWEIYTPSNMWMVVFAIGIFATIALFIYNQWLTRSERRAANLADSRH